MSGARAEGRSRLEVTVKQFACGDVVPGCRKTFSAVTVEDILGAVGAHAREDHGLAEVPPALVEQVRGRILTLA